MEMVARRTALAAKVGTPADVKARKSRQRPMVYVGMTVDVLHHGHTNILAEARKHGDVVVGLLTDQAIVDHKRLPALTYEQRKAILENIVGVTQVVPQTEWDYAPNIRRYKPDVMVHGDDWLSGPLLPLRDLALKALEEYGGRLIEIPYTKGVSSSALQNLTNGVGTTAEVRRAGLRRILKAKHLARFIEAHGPMSAMIAEATVVEGPAGARQFDGFWSSSLTDSASRGKPDIEIVDLSARLSNIDNIFEVTSKPLIMDCDTGGKPEHFQINVRTIERLGISSVIIEDKIGLKKNSLFGNDVVQEQDDPRAFAEKILAGRSALRSPDFMVIARIESLILDKGISDAMARANLYLPAGADGIMIHSRKKQPDEIREFARVFRAEHPFVPLVVVPTSFNSVTEAELEDWGFNVVIYANHMFRAAYPAMMSVARSILEHGRSLEAEAELMSINDILDLIPGTR